jgi:hypothetical protein
MTDNEQNKTSHDNDDAAVSDLKPTDRLDDARSLDIGESGQFAPGGYYNQQNATQTKRIDLDEQFSDSTGDKS